MWLDLTKASFHTHNSKADFSPPLDFYINELPQVEKPTTSWIPTIPNLHPYVITCDTGVKTI